MLASFVPLPIDFEMVPMFAWKRYSNFSETLTKKRLMKKKKERKKNRSNATCCNIFEFAICSNDWDKHYTWQRIIDYSSARYLIWGCILHFDSFRAQHMCAFLYKISVLSSGPLLIFLEKENKRNPITLLLQLFNYLYLFYLFFIQFPFNFLSEIWDWHHSNLADWLRVWTSEWWWNDISSEIAISLRFVR